MAVISQPPRVRCYQCGEAEIEHVCHHCGRAICERHNVSIPLSRRRANEFMGLRLRTSPAGEQGAHCAPCAKRHHKPSYQWLFIVAALLLITGFILNYFADSEHRPNLIRWSQQATQSGTYLLIGSLILTALLRLWDFLMNRQLRPVIPAIQSASITETMQGYITLDEQGSYEAKGTEGPSGELTMKFHIMPTERDRTRGFQWAANRFNAGFVTLEGAIKADFSEKADFVSDYIRTIALKDQIEGPFWMENLPHAWPWRKASTYTVPTPKDKTPAPPVEMIPILIQEAEKPTTLALTLQLPEKWRDLSGNTSSAVVESLVLFDIEDVQGISPLGSLPLAETEQAADELDENVALGEPDVEDVLLDEALAGNEVADVDELQPSIKWAGVSFIDDGKFVPSKSFYIRFAEKLDTLPTLRGKLKLRFAGTLSGIENLTFFYPTGVKRKGKGVRKSTIVEVDFEMDLSTLETQETIVRHEKTEWYEGVGSNYEVVSHLTNVLSGQTGHADGAQDHTNGFSFEGVYVKRVVENNPRVEKHDANLTNRYWDIGGRWYDELYPIDFHIIIKGVEAIEKPIRDTAQLEICVQGMVKTTPQLDEGVAEEMRERILQLHHHLQQTTNTELAIIKDERNHDRYSPYTLQARTATIER